VYRSLHILDQTCRGSFIRILKGSNFCSIKKFITSILYSSHLQPLQTRKLNPSPNYQTAIMAIKLYGMKISTCYRRVAAVLYEKNLDFELVEVNIMKGEQKSPGHLAKQPFGKIPVLDDNGFIVYESRAIAKYIAKKYAGQGTKLIPADGDVEGYALFEQACSMETSYFDGPASTIAYEKVFKAWRGAGAADEAILKTQTAALDATFKGYEAILSKQKYLAGNELTAADLFHLPYGIMIKEVGLADLFEKYPAVSKWFTGLTERESWVKVVS